MFNKSYVKGIEDTISGRVPKAIGLGIGSMSDEDAREGTVEKFRIVSGDKGKGTTADFSKMGERGLVPIPKLMGGLTIISGGASEIGKVGHSGDKLIPHVERRVAG